MKLLCLITVLERFRCPQGTQVALGCGVQRDAPPKRWEVGRRELVREGGGGGSRRERVPLTRVTTSAVSSAAGSAAYHPGPPTRKIHNHVVRATPRDRAPLLYCTCERDASACSGARPRLGWKVPVATLRVTTTALSPPLPPTPLPPTPLAPYPRPSSPLVGLFPPSPPPLSDPLDHQRAPEALSPWPGRIGR